MASGWHEGGSGKTHKDVVTEVFKKVRDKTQKPVRLGFDVVAVTKHGIDEPHVSNIIEVTTGKENLQFPTNFDAKFFVKQVKYLCADRHVSSALISSSEGLMMLSVGEPRLRKMLGRELPISKSKAYSRPWVRRTSAKRCSPTCPEPLRS